MFRVEYYENPKEYFNTSTTFLKGIHLASSYTLSTFLNEKYPDARVYTFDYYRQMIFPEWYSVLNDLYLESQILNWLNTVVDENSILYSHVEDLRESIKFLINSGIYWLSESVELSTEQKHFIKMYRSIQRDLSIQQYIENRRTFSKQDVMEKTKCYTDVIYIYQMDFIDAERTYFFHWLHQLGFKICFRIPFIKELKILHRNWLTVYEKLSQVHSSDWQCVQSGKTLMGTQFADFVEGNSNNFEIYDDERLEVIQFNHLYDLVQYNQLHGIEETVALRSSEFHAQTRDLSVNLETTPHFYVWPEGRFFKKLFHCEPLKDTIFLDYETYVELMVSGWIKTRNINSNKAYSLLNDLEPYMDGIKTIDDVLERLNQLIELQGFSQTFDQQAADQTKRDKVKQYLTNPFKVFSYLNNDRYDVTFHQLQELTSRLKQILLRLVPKDEEDYNVNEYLRSTLSFVQSVETYHQKDFLNKLSSISISNEWVLKKQQLEKLFAIIFSNEQSESRDFNQLAGLALRQTHVHLTDITLNTFPSSRGDLPYLLTYAWLKESINANSSSIARKSRLKHGIIVDYHSRKQSSQAMVYYLYFAIAYRKKQITLSWVKSIDKKDRPSIYLSVINQIYKQREDILEWNNITRDEFDWPDEKREPEIIDFEILQGQIPEVSWLDYDFCARKFYYSSIINHHPVYLDDFHQRLAFGIIGKLFSETGDGREGVRKFLYPLFPQWPTALKDNLIDVEFTKGLQDFKQFENIHYPKAMRSLQKLRSRYEVTRRWKIRDRYKKDTFIDTEIFPEVSKNIINEEVKAEPGHHCRMCPFLNVCTEGAYVIDEFSG